jgi:hypothetical protein
MARIVTEIWIYFFSQKVRISEPVVCSPYANYSLRRLSAYFFKRACALIVLLDDAVDHFDDSRAQ